MFPCPVIRLVIPSLWTGGGERVCATLANWWVSQGLGVEILLIHKGGGFRLSLDPRVQVTEFSHGRVAKALIPIAIHLNRARHTPALVFGVDLGAGLGFLRKIGLLKCPLLYREGSSPRDKNGSLLYRFGVSGADGVIAQSRVASEDLESLGVTGMPKRLIANPVVYAGGVSSVRPAPAEGAPRFLAVGRLVPVKGYDRLLEGFADLKNNSYPGATLTIAGDGGQRAELERQVSALGLTTSVNLCGHVDDLGPLFNGADIFVMASRYEGQPNAMIEALHHGCRVLASDIPALRELLQETGLGGCLVDNVGFAAALAGKTREVLAMPAEVWARAKLQVADRFRIEAVAADYLDFCRTVARAGGRGDGSIT